jgi:hypothetical protein
MPNWILDYVNSIEDVSEAPLQFHIWSAVSVIGAVLKRNIWVDYQTYTIYPNHYIVFVGPPGVGKGSAIHPAHEFAKESGLVNYMGDRATAPRIIEKLMQGFSAPLKVAGGQIVASVKDSTTTLMATELHVLLSSSEWMLDFLCDSWDRGSYDYDTKNKGSYTVKDMGISLIGGCVPDYVKRISRDKTATITSGFSARTIFVYAKKPSKTLLWGQKYRGNPVKAPYIKVLQSELARISQLQGEFKLDTMALDLWNSWKPTLTSTEDDTDVYRNFKARQHVHVLKLAMILSAADSISPPNTINRAKLAAAIRYIDEIADGVDEIFRGVGESDISSALARLELYIERKGEVSYSELLNDNMRFIDHDDVVRVLKILELTGFLTQTVVGTGFVYKWTGKPINPNAKKRTVTP